MPPGRALSQGSLYVPSKAENTLISDLKLITGAASLPTTGLPGATGLFLGLSGTFDTNTITDTVGFNKSFDNETELNQTGYIVRSDAGGDLFIVGTTAAGEQSAIDAFLQSSAVGLQNYGPANNDNNTNVWQVTPSLPTLSGSWDIRQVPTIAYVENNNFGLGTVTPVQNAWDNFMKANYGGGTPVPGVGQSNFNINATFSGRQASLLTHPDWWSEHSNDIGTVNSTGDGVVTFTPTGTINNGDTFSISLTTGGVSETITITATSTDNTPQGIVNALDAQILTYASTTNPSFAYFESSSIVVANTEIYDGGLTADSYGNPILEMYGVTGSGNKYQAGFFTSGHAGVALNKYTISSGDSQLNFTSPTLIDYIEQNYVANWLSNGQQPGSMLSLAPQDGNGYDQSGPTLALMHTNQPYQTNDNNNDWVGYNQNGVFVYADSESYWAMVNDVAEYVMANEAPRREFYTWADWPMKAWPTLLHSSSCPMSLWSFPRISRTRGSTTMRFSRPLATTAPRSACTRIGASIPRITATRPPATSCPPPSRRTGPCTTTTTFWPSRAKPP